MFQTDKKLHKQKIRLLSSNLQLNGKFIDSELPTFFAGDIESRTKKIIIVGINPGANEKNLKIEKQFKEKNFESYLRFQTDFFRLYKDKLKLPIKYYSYLSTCFADKRAKTVDRNYFEFCQNNFINIDLIPYHSKNFKLVLNDQNTEFLKEIFQQLINSISTLKVKFVVIHKSILLRLLRKINFVDHSAQVVFNKGTKKVYLVKKKGINFLVFSRFIPNGGFSRKDIQKIVGKLL